MFSMKVRFLLLFVFIFFVSSSFAEENETNKVILPETKFFVEGATSPVLEERDISLPSRESKKDIYENPSIKGIGDLEKEARKEFSKETKSKIISLFSYGLNDILNFSIIGLSQIPIDTSSLSTVISVVRFKRPDVVFYYDRPTTFRNTFKDTDFANVSLGFSSQTIFWNTSASFSEDFKGLWNNPHYLDEKDRNVKLESSFRYRIDKDSYLTSKFHIDHFHTTIRNSSFSTFESTFNEFFLNLGYIYGIEDYNSFGFDLGLGANLEKFIQTNTYFGSVFGNISITITFPLFQGNWLLKSRIGIVPITSKPMEFFANLGVSYKIYDNLIISLSLLKDYTKFSSDFLTRGLNVLEFSPNGDSSIGAEFGSKLFLLGNNNVNLSIGYAYYLSKIYDRYNLGLYTIDITNANSIYSRVVIDIISIDWINFSGTYKFFLFYPSLPYVPLHYIDLSLKLIFCGFNLTLTSFGEYTRGSTIGSYDIIPYLGVSFEIEWEIIKNLSLILKGENLLNNIIEVRKNSIISEPLYILGGLKVKL